jgi:hypothetical protein
MFALNTRSGMLHDTDVEDGGENAIEFARADEADLHAHSLGMTMKRCSKCFGDAPQSMELMPEGMEHADPDEDTPSDEEDD